LIEPGVYPASVTPFDSSGRIDTAGVARLLAHFEAAGCSGVVLAGTNGEGPSLSAVEKRDLVREAQAVRGGLDLILGIATSSLDEAVWLSKRAAEFGAIAVLVMPPGYFRTVEMEGIRAWFLRLMDSSPLPVIVYNFPKMTGITLDADLLASLVPHQRFAGVKDSSGDRVNLDAYRKAVPHGKVLFVGDERLLFEALKAGWTGTISGAANVVPNWLAEVVRLWLAADSEGSEAKFHLVLPAIEVIRGLPQPVGNKALLHRLGVLDSREPRLPLSALTDDALAGAIGVLRDRLGLFPS